MTDSPRSSSPGRPDRGPRRLDPADVAQLAESPVPARRVVALFAPYRWTVLVVVLLIVTSSTVALGQPFLIRAVIDRAIPDQDVALLLWIVGGMLAITVLTGLLGVVQTWLSTSVGQRVMHGLRTSVFEHLQRQSMRFFTRTRGGEIQSRLTHDIAGMQSVVTSTATSIASHVTTVLGTVIAMVALSWRLSLLSLIVIPPAIWVTRKVALLRREITARRQRHLAELHGQAEESLSVSGALLTRTLGTARVAVDRFASTSHELVDLEIRSQLAGRWRMATMNMVFAAIPALLYLVAGLPATSGGMTIGTLVAFTALQAGIFRPLMGLLDVGVDWVSSMALFSRIFGYLDLPVEVAPPLVPATVDVARVRGELRIEDVTFRYDAEGRPALDGIDLTVPAGSTLALVGETGSGKSTLAALVSRLHDPTSGRITIDGVDLRDLSFEDLTAIVGVVTQETYLIHASIRKNLLLARPAATEDELWEALRTAQAADLVRGLPRGLDTVVGARGHRFSGGEKQRLAVARALLRDPRILVLDEATSALDNRTERELQRALDALTVGRTTITIAHRLSTVRDADQIAVLERGRVVEVGTDASLRTADGRYARLLGSETLTAA